jgi:hypothetical protein
MQWLSAVPGLNRIASRAVEHNSLRIVRRAVATAQAADMISLATAVDEIITHEHWREAISSNDFPFNSFVNYILAAPPHGPGVSDQSAARMVRQALFEYNHFREWTAIMKVAARKPGNPGNGVNCESSRFYTVDRGSRSRDKLLLLLESQSPAHFERVCNGECSPHRAALEAGLISPLKKAHTSFESILHAAHGMKCKTQTKLLKRLFKELPLDAQCTLIADCMEAKLGSPGLATKWREASTEADAPEAQS